MMTMAKRFDGLMPVVIDLETGGVRYKTDALLEVAAVLLTMDEHGMLQPAERFSTHIEPFKGARIDPKALEINQIDPHHPFRFAIEETDALQRLFKMIEQAINAQRCRRAVLVGHNAHFDLYFLQAAIERCGLTSPFHAFTVIDTATLGGVFYQKTVLAKAIRAAGLKYNKDEAHSAVYDADITAALFCQIINTMRSGSQYAEADYSNNPPQQHPS